LLRGKYKFPGRQLIVVSNKWGFTPYTREQYQQYEAQGRLIDRGTHVKVKTATGRLGLDSIFTTRKTVSN